jgi:hypothetical protein
LGVDAIRASSSDKTAVWVATLVALPLLGAIVGYEATTHSEPRALVTAGSAGSALRGATSRPTQLVRWSVPF